MGDQAQNHDDDFCGSTRAGHLPVLADEVLQVLAPKPGEVMLDCTAGRGGHSSLIAPRLAPGGRLIALDVDPANVTCAQQILSSAAIPANVLRANFASAPAVLASLGLSGTGAGVDLLLADLGFASSQMSDPARGLSFATEGPLDMRLDPDLSQTAADLVNHLPQRELADLIYRYGEERLSRKIARKIVEERAASPILTTAALAQIVRRAYPRAARYQRHGKARPIDPATRTFMALRIAVNQELAALERLLEDLPRLLRPGARAAIISFHSLEDRLVKQAFLRLAQQGLALRLTRKPLTASEPERQRNPRSRSAKLRAIQWQPAEADSR